MKPKVSQAVITAFGVGVLSLVLLLFIWQFSFSLSPASVSHTVAIIIFLFPAVLGAIGLIAGIKVRKRASAKSVRGKPLIMPGVVCSSITVVLGCNFLWMLLRI